MAEEAEHQVQQPTEGLMCYLDGGRSLRDSYSTKGFHKYRITAPSRCTINLWYQSKNERGSRSHEGGNERPTIGVEKQNKIEEMFKADARRSLRQVSAVVEVHHKTVWHFLRNKSKLSSYCLQIWTTAVGNRQGKLCLICSTMQGEVAEKSKFPETHCFFRWGQLFIATGGERAKLQNPAF